MNGLVTRACARAPIVPRIQTNTLHLAPTTTGPALQADYTSNLTIQFKFNAVLSVGALSPSLITKIVLIPLQQESYCATIHFSLIISILDLTTNVIRTIEVQI